MKERERVGWEGEKKKEEGRGGGKEGRWEWLRGVEKEWGEKEGVRGGERCRGREKCGRICVSLFGWFLYWGYLILNDM